MADEPILAIIIPEFNQAQLAIEPIYDALNQAGSPAFIVVVGIDCSSGTEIDVICEAFTSTSDRIYTCRLQANLGLAGNRNSCVEYVRTAFPTVRALTFLDSDDRLHPYTIANFYEHFTFSASASAVRVGWIYTDPYQFGGIHGYLAKPHQYKVLWHLFANSNSATSLISMEVFEAGCHFDESMKKGSEDWAFWLSAIDKGFVGSFATPPTFAYRRRPESMSSDATYYKEDIALYIRSRFESLFATQSILRRELEEMPPYAYIDVGDASSSCFFSDWNCEKKPTTLDLILDSVASGRSDHHSTGLKAVLVSSKSDMKTVQDLGLVNWLCWFASQGDLAASVIHVVNSTSGNLRIVPSQPTCASSIIILNLRKISRQHTSTETLPAWTLEVPHLATNIASFDLACFLSKDLMPMIEARERDHPRLAFSHLPSWKPHGVDGFSLVSGLLGVNHHLPMIKADTRNLITFIAVGPIIRNVAIQHAIRMTVDALKEAGHRIVLTCSSEQLGTITCLVPKIVVDDIIVLTNEVFHSKRGDTKHYLGARLTPWMVFEPKSSTLGLFASADIVMNAGVHALSAIMYALRRRQIRTVAMIPPDVRRSRHRPRGTNMVSHSYGEFPFVDNVLSYEHAYDYIIAGSPNDIPWLTSRGLPSHKLRHQMSSWSIDLRSVYTDFVDPIPSETPNQNSDLSWLDPCS